MKYDLTPFCHKIRQSFVTLALHDNDDIHTTVTNTQLREVALTAVPPPSNSN
jgi:hypothetical protein